MDSAIGLRQGRNRSACREHSINSRISSAWNLLPTALGTQVSPAVLETFAACGLDHSRILTMRGQHVTSVQNVESWVRNINVKANPERQQQDTTISDKTFGGSPRMTSYMPSTMRAVVHDQGTQILTFSNEWPVPERDSSEYMLKVTAAAITTGELFWPRPPELQESHPGVEMSGSIVSAPRGGEFAPGDKVYMRTTYPRAGSLRDYSIGLESELAPSPRNISPEEAASVPVSALTAWQGLFVHAGLDSHFGLTSAKEIGGRKARIFVNGGSSAVGLWFIQLAHAAGYYVVATCSARNTDIVKQRGADEVIDYTNTTLREWLDGQDAKFDHVLDCVGLHKTPDCWHAVAEGGKLWTIVLPPGEIKWPPKWVLDVPADVSKTVSGRFFVMESSGEQLGKITELIEKGVVKPTVDSVWKLEEYEKAFERMNSGRAVGKVVLRVAKD